MAYCLGICWMIGGSGWLCTIVQGKSRPRYMSHVLFGSLKSSYIPQSVRNTIFNWLNEVGISFLSFA